MDKQESIRSLLDQHATDTNQIGKLMIAHVKMVEALRLIATGTWTVPNSIETITWLARKTWKEAREITGIE